MRTTSFVGVVFFLVAVCTVAASQCDCGPPEFYFAATDFRASSAAIERMQLTGQNIAPVLTVPETVRGLDLDPKARKLYWSQVQQLNLPAGIFRSNIDGSNPERIVATDVPFPNGVAVDSKNRKVYWGDQSSQRIERANLDGSGRELVLLTPFHVGLVLDVNAGLMYWSTSILDVFGEIWAANLDGSDPHLVQTRPDTAPFKPAQLALDRDGYIYWNDYVANVVQRAPLSAAPGTGIETLYSADGNIDPGPLAVVCDRLYFALDITGPNDIRTVNAVLRMRLDGSSLTTLVPDIVGAITALVVDRCPRV